MDKIEDNKNDSEGVQNDKLEQLEKYEEINPELAKTLSKMKEELAEIKSKTKVLTAKYKRTVKERSKLEKQFAKLQRIQENHVKNLKAQIQYDIIKRNDFNAEKIKNDKSAAEFLRKSSIANDREKCGAVAAGNNLLASSMASNSILNSFETKH